MLLRNGLRPFRLYETPTENNGGGGDEATKNFIRLRQQADNLEIDLKKERDAKLLIETELNTLKKKGMDEMELVRTENVELAKALEDLKPLIGEHGVFKKTNEDFSKFVSNLYEEKLKDIPEEAREQVKLLTHVESNPVVSLEKLTASLKLLGITGEPLKLGGTNGTGGGGTPPGKTPPENKKPQDIKWGDALRPIDDILAERRKRMGTA